MSGKFLFSNFGDNGPQLTFGFPIRGDYEKMREIN